MNFQALVSPEAWLAFGKVVLIDLVLAGDNAIVIGMAAAGLPKELRNRAILIGIAAATVLRILFALVAVSLLKFVGLLLVGGLLLLWVCWKMYRELMAFRGGHQPEDHDQPASGEDFDHDGLRPAKPKTLMDATIQIIVADISMSLDNVLAVAGAAREHPYVLAFGLFLSVGLMGLAASFIAKLLEKYRWVAWIGLLIIFYVAVEMVFKGTIEIWPHLKSAIV